MSERRRRVGEPEQIQELAPEQIEESVPGHVEEVVLEHIQEPIPDPADERRPDPADERSLDPVDDAIPRGPFGGGPVDAPLLPRYEQHETTYIWRGEV
jgi:hypothetical protein